VDSVLAGTPSVAIARDVKNTEAEIDLPYLLERTPEAVDRALDGLGRIGAIVRSMKEFARADQKEMVSADLNQAIVSTLTVARNEYKYVADTETDLGELPGILCHIGEINQVILNLIVNAAHAIADVVKDSGRRVGSRSAPDATATMW